MVIFKCYRWKKLRLKTVDVCPIPAGQSRAESDKKPPTVGLVYPMALQALITDFAWFKNQGKLNPEELSFLLLSRRRQKEPIRSDAPVLDLHFNPQTLLLPYNESHLPFN